MTKRTNQTKTTIYRRHATKCPINGQPNNVTNCECPLWLHGKVRGRFLRQSLDTRMLSTAERKQNDIENGNDDDPTPDGGPKLVPKKGNETLEYAVAEFLETNTGLSSSTQKLYRGAVEHFAEWAGKQEIIALASVDNTLLHRYFKANPGWKRNTAQSRLTHLRVFFNYCCRTKHWLTFPPTEDRTLNQNGAKKGGSSSTRVPFTPIEVTAILAAVELMPEVDRDRARALIYLLLYSGMRISDATFAERCCLTPAGNMDYWVIKTRRPITLPPGLLPPAIDALQKLPASRVYFFQQDQTDDYREARAALRNGEEFATLMPGYEARIRATTALVLKVLALAGLEGACHRFRDTFAVNMLVGDGTHGAGADVYTLSQMLGHSDVKITQKHYLKLVPGYRERMSKATRVLAYQFPVAV